MTKEKNKMATVAQALHTPEWVLWACLASAAAGAVLVTIGLRRKRR